MGRKPSVVIIGLFFLVIFVLVRLSIFDLGNIHLTPFNYLPKSRSDTIPGNCLVLVNRYCHSGLPQFYMSEPVGVGFKLPAGTQVFAPFDGRVVPSSIGLPRDGKYYVYKSLEVYPGKANTGLWQNTQLIILVFDRPTLDIHNRVNKGESLGFLTDRKIDVLGDYNLLVYVSDPSKKALKPNLQLTIKFFAQ